MTTRTVPGTPEPPDHDPPGSTASPGSSEKSDSAGPSTPGPGRYELDGSGRPRPPRQWWDRRSWRQRESQRRLWRRRRSQLGPQRRSRLGPLTFATTQLVLLFWWVAFYPGTLSYDSVMYVWQATTGNWTTQHSVLYNGLVWLSLHTTGQLAALTLAQTVAMAWGLAYAVTGLRRLRVPGRWLAAAAVAATCLPAVGTFTVYVSKDVPFAICQVWLLGSLARIITASEHRRAAKALTDAQKAERAHDETYRKIEDGPRADRDVAGHTAAGPRREAGLFVAVFVELALMALFRQNAFVVIVLTAAVLLVVLAGQRWRVAAAATAALALGLLANVALYPALGVRPAGPELVLGPAYADIAVAYADQPERFGADERQLLASVAPLDYWSETANCYNADSTVTYGAPEFDMLAARERRTELFDLWLRLVKRMPDQMIQTRLCRGSIGWNPFPGPWRGRTVKIPIAGVADLFDFPRGRLAQSPFAGAIRSAPRHDGVHAAAVFARRASDTRAFEWFTWRGATWALVAYVAVIALARRRRDVALLGLVAVVAAGQLNVMMNNPGQLVRYMMGPLILGILLAPLAFVRRDTGQNHPDPTTSPTPSAATSAELQTVRAAQPRRAGQARSTVQVWRPHD